MDLYPILLITGLFVLSAVLSFASGTPPSLSSDGSRVLAQYGRPMRAFGVSLSVFVISAGVLAARHPEVKGLDAVFFIVFPSLLGIYLSLEELRTRFEYDDDSLSATTPFKKRESIPWTDVIDIEYSSWGSNYILTLKDGTKIRVSEHLNGSEALMDFARRWKTYNSGKS